jgi:hypothetical protein
MGRGILVVPTVIVKPTRLDELQADPLDRDHPGGPRRRVESSRTGGEIPMSDWPILNRNDAVHLREIAVPVGGIGTRSFAPVGRRWTPGT